MLGSSPSDMTGFNEITFVLAGDDGVDPHRSTRADRTGSSGCPVTESQGRIHTSSATVTVLPEAEEVDVRHRPERPQDRRLPLDGSGRAVGQHHRLGRADHPPADRASSWPCRTRRARSRTGPRPWSCSGPGCSRSSRTGSRPSCPTPDAARSAAAGARRRSGRTTSRRTGVTDHRIGLTIYKLDKVLAGELDDVIDALVADERSHQLQDDPVAS